MPSFLGLGRRRKTPRFISLDEYAPLVQEVAAFLFDDRPEAPESAGVEDLIAQSERWDRLRAMTSALEAVQPDDRLTDVHKGVVGVSLGALSVLNCLNASLTGWMAGKHKDAQTWARRADEGVPKLNYNALYLGQRLQSLREAHPSVYETLDLPIRFVASLCDTERDVFDWFFQPLDDE
jgi:hypothetical protein